MSKKKTIRFASRMDQLPPYLFGMINSMKMEKRRKGDDVIDLGMGNPVDPTSETVIDKLIEVAKDPKTHRYPDSSGMKNLKKEISKYYKRHYGIDIKPEKETYFTIGSKEGILIMVFFSAIQIAGIIALRDCDDTIPEQVALYQARRDTLCNGLERIGWQVDKPGAGMFAWVKIPEPYIQMGSMQFAIEMMNRANVAVAPGVGFSEEGEGYLRLALVENEERLRQAVRQIKRALQEMDSDI